MRFLKRLQTAAQAHTDVFYLLAILTLPVLVAWGFCVFYGP